MAARILLIAGASALLVLALSRHHDAARCADARSAAFALGQGRAVPGGVGGTVRDLRAACRGGSDLAAGAGSLQRIGRLADADALARRAVRLDPDGEDGWVALALVARRRGDAATARRAVARVHALDPRYRFSG